MLAIEEDRTKTKVPVTSDGHEPSGKDQSSMRDYGSRRSLRQDVYKCPYITLDFFQRGQGLGERISFRSVPTSFTSLYVFSINTISIPKFLKNLYPPSLLSLTVFILFSLFFGQLSRCLTTTAKAKHPTVSHNHSIPRHIPDLPGQKQSRDNKFTKNFCKVRDFIHLRQDSQLDPLSVAGYLWYQAHLPGLYWPAPGKMKSISTVPPGAIKHKPLNCSPNQRLLTISTTCIQLVTTRPAGTSPHPRPTPAPSGPHSPGPRSHPPRTKLAPRSLRPENLTTKNPPVRIPSFTLRTGSNDVTKVNPAHLLAPSHAGVSDHPTPPKSPHQRRMFQPQRHITKTLHLSPPTSNPTNVRVPPSFPQKSRPFPQGTIWNGHHLYVPSSQTTNPLPSIPHNHHSKPHSRNPSVHAHVAPTDGPRLTWNPHNPSRTQHLPV
ncbi:uncharacterized protein CLUP02_09936 [Colletotrichum lupini]|uniref:Uncharacterized protein n=1 Tax=Colletotrichum lupini TaxID=145971 RepID=A0A9Q8SVT1_9PEZI|nr:uncharacterized protein CLUP02_09936 [Colletotrichum lupini]UQC84439.1 hypothetical protein CLUP02_09936 [Colletotrichum lupini]